MGGGESSNWRRDNQWGWNKTTLRQKQEVQQEYQEDNYQPQEESLNFSEEKLDEEINSEETENNNSEGLNLNFDFDDNIQEEDNQQAQLGIF